LLPDRLGILHRLIAVREMWLHQLGSLDRIILRSGRRFDVRLLLREIQAFARKRSRQDYEQHEQREFANFQKQSTHDQFSFTVR